MHFKKRLSKMHILATAALLGMCSVVHAQVNYYECVDLGFVDHTFSSKAGIIATTNRGTDIMLLKNNKLQPVVTGPGAGMYVNISPDGQYIGFKSINDNADQAPALYDVLSGKITLLENYSNQCGQVSFASDGTMAYTVGNTLYVRKGNNKRTFDLGTYVNIANISPDATHVAFASLEGTMFILDLTTGHYDQISGEGCYNPIWSPDASKIAVQQVNGKLFTFNTTDRAIANLGEASSVSWTEDSRSLVLTRPERINELQVKGASVIKVNSDGSDLQTLVPLTESTPVAVRAEGNSLIVSYAAGDKRGVSRISFNGGLRAGAPAKEIAMSSVAKKERIGTNLVTNFKGFARRDVLTMGAEKEYTEDDIAAMRMQAQSPAAKGNDIGLTAIPYINQVWDTPSSHDGTYAYGYVCCAPSSSCMLLGWLGYLSPVNVTSRSSYAAVKTCKYSWYVGRQYTSKTGYTFSKSAYGGGYWGSSNDVRGGYGYMWGYGSPASMMAKFHTNNGCANSYFESSLSVLRRECNANRPYIICLANGTGGHVVIVFRADQQAANDGSSTWAKSGSFICHDPYGDYNSSSYPNWDGRYSTYDWPGVNNGKANIGSFYWGCVTTYSSTPPQTSNPTITVSPENIHFNCKVNEHPSVSVKVTGKDLSNKITIGSIAPGRFTPSVTELPATGGTFTVTFNISDKAGTYKQGGTGVDYNFFIRVKSGSTEKVIPVTAEVTAPPLSGITEKYCYAVNRNNVSEKGYDMSKIRNFCYNDGKLYCVYDNKDILVLNAQTGDKLGFLSNGSVVGGGTLKLCDVKVIDGHIVACNLAVTGQALRLYCWDNDNALPYLLYETSDFQGAPRIGDCMEITGNLQNDVWFAFGNDAGGVTRIVEYNRKDGNWLAKNTQVFGTNNKQYVCGATVRAYPKGSGWWIDGKNSQPAWTVWNDEVSGAKVQTTCPVPFDRGSSHHEFYWKGLKYAASMVFADKDGSSCKMRIINDQSGDFKTTSEIGQYPSDGLGGANNTNGTGDIMINTDGENYLEAWILSTTQGLAYFTTGNVPTTTPQPITPPVTADPTVSADKSSVSLEANVGESSSTVINVTAANLRSNITAKLSGANADMFTVSPSSLSASGKLEVFYSPRSEGSHSATLTLSSTDVSNVVITLSGKATAAAEPFDDNITADKVKEVWVYSPNHEMGPWHANEAANPYTRSIAYNDGKLYVLVSRSYNVGKILIVDAYTGTKTGELSVSGISGGLSPLSSICMIDGKLYGSNQAKTSDEFKLYCWDNDSADPRLVFTDATHGGEDMGGKISFTGVGNTGRLWTVNNGCKKALYYNVNNGSFSTSPTVITLNGINDAAFGSAGDQHGVADVVAHGDGTYWIVSKDNVPTRFNDNGNAIEEVPAAAIGASKSGTSMKIIPFGTKTYAAFTTYKANAIENGQMTLVDVTEGGPAKASAPIVTVPEKGLGATRNSQFFTQVIHGYRHNEHVLDLWTNSALQGIAHYSYDGGGWTGVNNVAVDGGELMPVLDGICVRLADGGNASFIVANLAGAVVASAADTDSLDVAHLPAGLYIIVATDNNGHSKAIKVVLH